MLKKILFIVITILTVLAGLIAIVGIGVASADAPSTNVASSGIPRSVFRQDRLDAEAEVLNTTVANLKTARQDKTFASLLSNAGLTRKSFVQKVKAQLTSDLESQGYSQDQITIALQHKTIVRLRHQHKK